MKFSHFIPRDLYFGMILRCPECQGERREARGVVQVKGNFQEIGYLACECTAPEGIVKV